MSRLTITLTLTLALAGCATEPPEPVVCDTDAPLVRAAERDVLVRQTPSEPVGALVLFHGLGETACTWWDRTEGRRLGDLALAEGLLVVAPDSGKRSWGTGWPDNDDVAAVDAALTELVSGGVLPDVLPAAALGHSNGGVFAPIWAETTGAWESIAAVDANGWGSDAIGSDASPPPLLFIRAANDLVVPPGMTKAAADRAEDAGHVVESIKNVRQPVTATRLARIEGLSNEDAQRVVDGLDDAGLLDGERRLNVNPRLDARWRDAIPDDLRSLEAAVEEQLHVLYAEHRFSSDNSDAILRFVADRLP